MSTILSFKPVNDKQKAFIESTSEFILLSGAVGAGKSFSGLWKGFMMNLIYPGNSGLICRKELTSLKSSTLVTLIEQILPAEMIVTHNKQEGYIIHKTMVPGVNSKITYGGLDKKADQSSPTKIGSPEYGWIFIDEITEISLEDWEVLITRTRYKVTPRVFKKIKEHMKLKIKYKEYVDAMVRQTFGATNPDGPKHFLYKFFITDEDKPGREVYFVTPYDTR